MSAEVKAPTNDELRAVVISEEHERAAEQILSVGYREGFTKRRVAYALALAAQPGDALRDRLAKVRGMRELERVRGVLRVALTIGRRWPFEGSKPGENGDYCDALVAVLALIGRDDE